MIELPSIDKIKTIDKLDDLVQIAIENNFFKYINKFAINTLNLKKIKIDYMAI